jgi:DNA-binding winged helix-turn-helix (wHTH) protein
MLFAFDDFVLDCDRRELRHGAALVPVEPKVLDFLTYMVRNRHRVVSKDELIDAVWMGRIVSDSALATCVCSARAALGRTLPRGRLSA